MNNLVPTKKEQEPQKEEQAPQNAEQVQLNVSQVQLNVEKAQMNVEKAQMNVEQCPKNGEQDPKKDDSRLFGFLEKMFVLLATVLVPVGAYLWSTMDSLPVGLGKWLLAVAFFFAIMIGMGLIFKKLSQLWQS
ncbi:MAG: hypothetical protein H9847_08900 [Candidatus Anaerobiospirillum pullicola]|uniref:Uncharacterized protein n=1 Tax=Candidatus Anaerobiospirillum pullicola TaxID=2838451 RepID=A0A948WYM4_9GAMM|nr:hypothetical protein [Candidatus Anaerobiospirillum pullicola]